MWVPETIGRNIEHLCPEFARWRPSQVVDCCAHDMWGAGCLMQRAFTGTAPWTFPLVGGDMTNCQTLSKLYEAWVRPSPQLLRFCTTTDTWWML